MISKSLIKSSFKTKLDKRSKYLRSLVLNGLQNSSKGHVGSSFSMIEILRVLYDDIMKFNPRKPLWDGRDRLIISPGWSSLALYSILADKGFINKKELDNFMDLNSILGGCIEITVNGVEATTGSCGHGLSIAVGKAIALKNKKSKSKVFVILGDGEHGEGSIWEAAISSSKNKLDNLIIIVDSNKIQCSGMFDQISGMNSLAEKWKAFGLRVEEINGHNLKQIKKTLNKVPLKKNMPTDIICHTVMSKGIKEFENNPEYHWKGGLSKEKINEIKILLQQY